MNVKKIALWLLLMLVTGVAHSYDSKQHMIDDKLDILANAILKEKNEMLKRLPWSGISEEELFDPIAEGL